MKKGLSILVLLLCSLAAVTVTASDVSLDSLNVVRMQNAGLDIGSNPASAEDLDRIYHVYLNLKYPLRNGDSFDEPLLFKDNSGQGFIATLTQSNTFSVHRFDIDTLRLEYRNSTNKAKYISFLTGKDVNHQIGNRYSHSSPEHETFRLVYDNHYGFFSDIGMDLLSGNFFTNTAGLKFKEFDSLERKTIEFYHIDKYSERYKWSEHLRFYLANKRSELGRNGIAIRSHHGKKTTFYENDNEFYEMKISLFENKDFARRKVKSRFLTYINPNNNSVVVYYKTLGGVRNMDITGELATINQLSSLVRKILERHPDLIRSSFPGLSELASTYNMGTALNVGKQLISELGIK